LNSTCNEDNINFFRENINTELKNTQYDWREVHLEVKGEENIFLYVCVWN
jgi:hypothetical protein